MTDDEPADPENGENQPIRGGIEETFSLPKEEVEEFFNRLPLSDVYNGVSLDDADGKGNVSEGGRMDPATPRPGFIQFECAECGGPLSTEYMSTRYCSEACEDTAWKRARQFLRESTAD